MFRFLQLSCPVLVQYLELTPLQPNKIKYLLLHIRQTLIVNLCAKNLTILIVIHHIDVVVDQHFHFHL